MTNTDNAPPLTRAVPVAVQLPQNRLSDPPGNLSAHRKNPA